MVLPHDGNPPPSGLQTNFRLLLITFHLFHMYEPSWSQSTGESSLPADSLEASSRHLICPHHWNLRECCSGPWTQSQQRRLILFCYLLTCCLLFGLLTFISNSIIWYSGRLPYPSIHTVFLIFLCCGFAIPYLINQVNGFALRFEIFKCNPLSCIGTARI